MTADLLLTDAGIETTLVFHEGIELPDFAGFQLDTPTWRANPDWGARLGYDAAALDRVNRDAVAFARELAATAPDVAVRVAGIVGPRGDGYVVGDRMTPEEAEAYHGPQVRSFAAARA